VLLVVINLLGYSCQQIVPQYLDLIFLSLQSMETRSTIPDRKLLARLVIVREEARNMMGGGLLDERNDRGLNTLPQAEVCFKYVVTPDHNTVGIFIY
jgi:hypothetical protein